MFGALLRLLIVATGFYWVTSSTSVDSALSMLAGTAIVCVVVAAMGLRFGPWGLNEDSD